MPAPGTDSLGEFASPAAAACSGQRPNRATDPVLSLLRDADDLLDLAAACDEYRQRGPNIPATPSSWRAGCCVSRRAGIPPKAFCLTRDQARERGTKESGLRTSYRCI